jgi:predicted nucleic acid-binding protein
MPAIDLVIAAVALNNGLRLVTKDKNFLLVKEVEKRL